MLFRFPFLEPKKLPWTIRGRILVGTKLRKRLGPEFAMTLGSNGSINAFPRYVWDVLVRDLLSRDPRQKARQDYARHLMGNSADELDFDAQGRVVVPKKLRELASIEEKVVIVGMGDYLEIWAKPIYDHMKKTCSQPGRCASGDACGTEIQARPGKERDSESK